MRDLLRREDGISLVELLVAMALGTVVMLAVFTTFDTFRVTSEQNTRLNDASDRAREELARIARNVRSSTAVTRVSPLELVVQQQGKYRRWCITGDDLYAGDSATVPGAACPGVADRRVIDRVPTAGIFTSGSNGTVGVNLGVSYGVQNLRPNETTRLVSSAQSRGVRETRPNANPGTVTPNCPKPGTSGNPTVSLGTGLAGTNAVFRDADTGQLLASTGTTASLTSSAQNLEITVTDALGLSSTIFTSVTC